MIPLTIMSDIDRSARVENGENAGIFKACSIRGTELDLGAETETMRAGVFLTNRCTTYLCAVERWARPNGIGDVEGV